MTTSGTPGTPRSALLAVGPTAVDSGKLVISAAKALKPFTAADPTRTALLYGTWEAGRIGLLAFALRHQGRISRARFLTLAAEEGFSPPECDKSVIPALRQSGLIDVRKGLPSQTMEIESLVLTTEGLLEAIASIYEAMEPTPTDRCALRLLFEAERVPLPQSIALNILAEHFGEETAKKGTSVARAYNIVTAKEGYGLKEPLLFSEKVWSGKMNRAGKAMAGLARDDREALAAIIEKVRTYQGVPETIIRQDAIQNNAQVKG